MSTVEWLPPIIRFGGDYSVFVSELHHVFVSNFFSRPKPQLFSKDVIVPWRDQADFIDGKHPLFWHMVTEGPVEANREPTINKASQLPWARAVIDNHADPRVGICRTKDRKGTCLLLWLREEEYVVVVGERASRFILITAYPTYRIKDRNRLNRQFQQGEVLQ